MSGPCLAVAYSGGRDSSALLHATLAAAAPLGLAVVALHVHHGLSPQADAWLAHCEAQCRRWAARGRPIAFAHRRLAGAPQRGESVEAWARRERYAALHEMAEAHYASIVLLAHHRRDQAETLLLQALRGAGVAGLAAMPHSAQRGGVTWARPWLDVDPARIDAYVRRYRLQHIEDDTNADARFARNRLRLQVWPALIAAFPDAQNALAKSAHWAQEARACSEALAAIDLAAIADARGFDLAAWWGLVPERRSNALRGWLKGQTGVAPSSASMERLLCELTASATPARWPLGSFELRRYRGWLSCREIADPAALQSRVSTVAMTRAGHYALAGWGGSLRLRRVTQGGVALGTLAQARLVERTGGEQFQSAPDRPPRSLKKQFQSRGVPQWNRQGPLVYDEERLVFVPGLGIDARVLAAPGQAQVSLEWLADPS